MIVLPLPVMVPTEVFPLATPSTLQLTAVLVVPVTEAVKDVLVDTLRLPEEGLMVTAMGAGGRTVMAVEMVFRVSATLVATTE